MSYSEHPKEELESRVTQLVADQYPEGLIAWVFSPSCCIRYIVPRRQHVYIDRSINLVVMYNKNNKVCIDSCVYYDLVDDDGYSEDSIEIVIEVVQQVETNQGNAYNLFVHTLADLHGMYWDLDLNLEPEITLLASDEKEDLDINLFVFEVDGVKYACRMLEGDNLKFANDCKEERRKYVYECLLYEIH
jgi:hypothetical protein